MSASSTTLHLGLQRDFKDLLNAGKITKAEQLSKDLTNLLGQTIYFSHFGEPHYPVHNLDAKTVFVHLNPGSGLGNTSSSENFYSQRWNREEFFRLHQLNESAGLEEVLSAYKRGCRKAIRVGGLITLQLWRMWKNGLIQQCG